MDPEWCAKAARPPKKEESPERVVWLDCTAAVAYLWENRLDVGSWMGATGCLHGKVNTIINDHRRLHEIKRLEVEFGLPRELVETTKNLADVHVSMRMSANRAQIDKAMEPWWITKRTMAEKLCQTMHVGRSFNYAYQAVHVALKAVEENQALTYQQVLQLASALSLSVFDIAEPYPIIRARANRYDKKGAKDA